MAAGQLECTDPTGDSVVTLAERRPSVVVAPGETVTCTFTNGRFGGSLPATGNDDLRQMLSTGALLAGLGALFVAFNRRRRTPA